MNTLRVGAPALDGGPPLPIEGARLFLNGPRVRLLIIYHEPTPDEVEAIQSADIELAVYHENGIAAVVARAGEADGYWRVEARAPLILLDVEEHMDGASQEHVRAEMALCGTERSIVRAIRNFLVPASVVRAACKAAHAQAARFSSVAAAVRAHECILRSHTVRSMTERAVARVRIDA